jgi:hypothetical protein
VIQLDSKKNTVRFILVFTRGTADSAPDKQPATTGHEPSKTNRNQQEINMKTIIATLAVTLAVAAAALPASAGYVAPDLTNLQRALVVGTP